MREAFDEEQLRTLISTGAVREAKACLAKGSQTKWTLEVRLGGAGSRWIPIRSAREPVRVWLSPTALVNFARKVGLMTFVIELW